MFKLKGQQVSKIIRKYWVDKPKSQSKVQAPNLKNQFQKGKAQRSKTINKSPTYKLQGLSLSTSSLVIV